MKARLIAILLVGMVLLGGAYWYRAIRPYQDLDRVLQEARGVLRNADAYAGNEAYLEGLLDTYHKPAFEEAIVSGKIDEDKYYINVFNKMIYHIIQTDAREDLARNVRNFAVGQQFFVDPGGKP